MAKFKNKYGLSFMHIVIAAVVLGFVFAGYILAERLIVSANAYKLITQISKYDAATKFFFSVYKTYPGDSYHFTPAGDGNRKFDDLIGKCSRAPNDKMINIEKYHFWTHLSQAEMLADEKYIPYEPKSCGGKHSDNWFSISLAGKVWPFIELDEVAAGRLIEDNKKFSIKPPIAADFDAEKKQVYLTFYTNAVDATYFAKKFEREESAVKAVDLINQYGAEKCRSAIGEEIVDCDSEDAALAKFVYFIAP